MKVKYVLTGIVIGGGFFLLSNFLVPVQRSTSSSNTLKAPVVLVQATAEVDNDIPQKLYPCLPKQVEKLILAASSITKQNTYYLIEVHQTAQPLSTTKAPPPTYEQTLVKLDKLGCLVVVPKEKMGAVSLIQYVPESVARELSLQMYKKAIAQTGGKEKFQRLWNEDDGEAGEKTYLFPENVWALQQLGIKIPSRVQVIRDVDQLKFE